MPPICEELGGEFMFKCDVTSDDEIEAGAQLVKEKWGDVDVLVHSIAYANREDLKGRFIDTSREGYKVALDVSSFSLVALCRAYEKLFKPGSSVLTLSYYGAGKVVANYNAMGVAKAALEACVRYLSVDLGEAGVRINAISAGPVKTMAASGISGFKSILGPHRGKGPPAPKHHHRRRGQMRSVSGLGPFLRHHRGYRVRGFRVQHHGRVGAVRCRNSASE